ncbi:SWIM zinc finger family protein [Streptomyces sp. RY43-2]|uniref:SWIM zinc finger family protein n=1 Tax=Streptomyces macrolidinus TaxID=2952607 RepID=A0ABT0ZD56_9ACTN|nr:SWIM zinc finger family protein [Streptomyces macrolidinus]MCN9241509.1 SWIM zinc finger family protein [Streptomyces macrolidinus]
MTRADLRALTPETLAALANRGLVKRAEKDLAAGSGPEVTTTADSAVHGTFPDGTKTVLPAGVGLDAADCSCGAAGVCRHRLALVLAYQRRPSTTTADGPDEPPASVQPAATERLFVDWSPGEFDDGTLTASLGRPALTAARRVLDRGYTARLHRARPEDPIPRVELPTCTVSFPVPHELGYALTDAVGALRGEVVALAVWAFRTANTADAGGMADTADTEQTTHVTVGGRTVATATATSTTTTTTTSDARGDDALRTALALADELLLDGVQQAGPVFAASLRRCHKALTAASRHWPAGAVAELREQVDAYAARSAHYDPARFALLLTELHARHRAAERDPVGVLGTKEAPTTPLRRVRLVALGCRVSGTARDRTAETFFAHADAGVTLVLRKRWELTEGQELTGHELSARRLLNSPLRALATANVVSEHTARAADRTVTISRGRIAATSVTPVGSAWTELPATLLVRDVAAHLRAIGDRPPQLIRPRVAAESVRVVAVAAVESIGYDPAGQVLEAVLRDPAGNEVLVRAAYNPLCPGGLDALAAALGDEDVRCVSGMLTRAQGRVVLEPLAVLTSTGVVVPDLAPGDGTTALAPASPRRADPITTALESALAALADAAHQGLRRLTAPARTAVTDSADRLHRTGLHTAAQHLRELDALLQREGAIAALPAWVNASLHLAVSLETHASLADHRSEQPTDH